MKKDYIICSSVNSSDYNNIPIFDITKVSITNMTEIFKNNNNNNDNNSNKLLRHTNFYINESDLSM